MEPETHKKKNRKYIMGFMDGNIFVMLDALELWIRGIWKRKRLDWKRNIFYEDVKLVNNEDDSPYQLVWAIVMLLSRVKVKKMRWKKKTQKNPMEKGVAWQRWGEGIS